MLYNTYCVYIYSYLKLTRPAIALALFPTRISNTQIPFAYTVRVFFLLRIYLCIHSYIYHIFSVVCTFFVSNSYVCVICLLLFSLQLLQWSVYGVDLFVSFVCGCQCDACSDNYDWMRYSFCIIYSFIWCIHILGSIFQCTPEKKHSICAISHQTCRAECIFVLILIEYDVHIRISYIA